MSALLQIALTNAVLALGLAVIAWASSFLRRPAVTHALWLLVLLRLVMPPVWQLPLPVWKAGHEATGSERVAGAFLDPHPTSETPNAPATRPTPPAIDTEPRIADDALLPLGSPTLIVVHAAPALDETGPQPATTEWPWLGIAGGVWLAGAVVCLAVAGRRVIVFRRVLRHVAPAPAAWQTTSDRLARRFGLRRGPAVEIVGGSLSPLLWAGFGRPRLILPEKLMDGLGTVERAAIMAHELAHLRRYDHWVRRLELVVTAMYWWFPPVWLARRELREAGEQCCDLWVVWALPKARRAYATALVDTVDFLSGASRAADAAPLTPLPPLASGVGEVRHLRRRISMIMRSSSVPRRLTRLGLIAGLGAGLMTLMLTPGRADDDPPRPPEPPRPPVPRERQKDQDTPRPRTERGERARDNEIERARAEIHDLQQTMQKTQQALMRAEQRLAELEGRPMAGGFGRGGFGGGGGFGSGGFGGGFGGSTPPRGEGGDRAAGPRGGARSGGGGGVTGGPGFPGGDRGGFGGFGPGGPPGGADQRMQALERSLEDLRRELNSLRRELRRPDGDSPQPGPAGRRGRVPPGAPGEPTAPPAAPRQPDVPRTPAPPAPPRPPEPPPSDSV
jgi:beta-lactamase regulating signal transducer with metallopeptidase domain